MTAPYPELRGDEPCLDTADKDIFFDDVPAAIDLCNRCETRRSCLAFALTHDVRGVWGATSEPTRRDIRREHGIHAVPLYFSAPPTPAPKEPTDD